jgi:hypothetical protein
LIADTVGTPFLVENWRGINNVSDYEIIELILSTDAARFAPEIRTPISEDVCHNAHLLYVMLMNPAVLSFVGPI